MSAFRPSQRGAIVKLFLRAVLLSATVAGGLVVPTFPASAAPINCLSTYQSYFAGTATAASDLTGQTYEGTTAWIENNSGPICDTSSMPVENNFNTTWTMLAENESQGLNRGYAQVGYFRYWGSCTYWFMEWKQNPANTFFRYIDTPVGCRTGGGTNFTTSYSPSDGFEYLKASTVTIGHTPFSPYVEWFPSSFGNLEPEISSETKYIGTDVPGTASDPTSVTDIELQNHNDSWTPSTETFRGFLHICPWPVRYAKTPLASHAFNFYSTTSTSTAINSVCG